MGTLAQSLAGVAVAAVTASNAFAADGSRLGLPDDGAQKLYIFGVGSTSITEVCAPKEGDIVCKMNIVFGSEGRAFDDKTQTLHGYGRDGETGDVTSTAPTVTYKGDGSGIIATDGQARHISARSDRVLIEEHGRGTTDFDARRRATPFDPDNYKVEGASLTTIETAMREAGVIGADPKYRLLDGVSRFSKSENSISETSCTLVPPRGKDPAKFDLDVSGAERAFCLTRTYNSNSRLGNPESVTMTLAIYGLNADGQLMSATIEDTRPAGIGANGAITPTDANRAQFAVERLDQGLNYTAR